jgi:hypothetical protein
MGFPDIEWRNYSFKRHLEAAKATNPIVTVALDIRNLRDLRRIAGSGFSLFNTILESIGNNLRC